MRMPFNEFIAHGDLKFIIAFLIFSALAIYHFIKKVQARKNTESLHLENHYNSRINAASSWILILTVLSLLLGFLHGFYFIGKAGGMAPNLIFQGVSYALITPIIGIVLFIMCKLLNQIFNRKTIK